MKPVNSQVFSNKSLKTIDIIIMALELKKPVNFHLYFPTEISIIKEFLILPLEDSRFEFSYIKSDTIGILQGTLVYIEK